MNNMARFGMMAALLAAMVTGCNEPLDKPVVTFDTASANCEQPLALFKFEDEVKVVGDYAVDLEYQADGGVWFPLKRIVSAEQSGTEELFPVIGYGKMTKTEKGIPVPTGYWADSRYRLWYPVYTDVDRWYWAPGTLPVVIGHGDIDWNVSSLKILVLAAIAGFVIDDLNIDVDLPFFGIGVEDDDVVAPPKAGVFGITRTGKYRCTVFANGYAIESEEFNLTMPSVSCGEVEEDSDDDGIPDSVDNCDNAANPDQANLDGDSLGDVCDNDDDGDGVSDATDNCPRTANSNQLDSDGDGIGNACDSTPYPPDSDDDGIPDSVDNCDNAANPDQANLDGDSLGDVCDNDDDGDGVSDATDNCPRTANSNQLDSDGDGIGNACDSTPYPPDSDDDGIPDSVDNCDGDFNPYQEDADDDGIGDLCDPDNPVSILVTPDGPLDLEVGDTEVFSLQVDGGAFNRTITMTVGLQTKSPQFVEIWQSATSVSIVRSVPNSVDGVSVVRTGVNELDISYRFDASTEGQTVSIWFVVASGGPDRHTASQMVEVVVNRPTVVMPNLVGKTKTEAQTLLNQADLVGEFPEEYNATVVANRIIRQEPAVGTVLGVGTIVRAVVSRGPEPATSGPVPDVTNFTEAAARTTLTNAGFNPGTKTEETSATVPAGQVIRTSPSAGYVIAFGTTINLVVSSGPPVLGELGVIFECLDQAGEQLIFTQGELRRFRVTGVNNQLPSVVYINSSASKSGEVLFDQVVVAGKAVPILYDKNNKAFFTLSLGSTGGSVDFSLLFTAHTAGQFAPIFVELEDPRGSVFTSLLVRVDQ